MPAQSNITPDTKTVPFELGSAIAKGIERAEFQRWQDAQAQPQDNIRTWVNSIRELNELPDEDMEGPWQPAEAHLHKRKRMQLDAFEVPRAARCAPSEEI